MGSLASLKDFLEKHPSIKGYTPSHASFSSISEVYLTTTAVPSLIARPQSADDVAALVSHCVATSTPFVVRAGGHDLSSRSTVDGILQIDLRDISHVTVSSDRKSARLGGGVLMGKLLEELEKDGLTTPTGTVGTVGYVGWATFGGYGPYSPSLGLGCDQILVAKVVLASGKVVDADEELLKGIRGAGPALGVIVEVEIKVYPKEEIQAGMVLYDSQDLHAAVKTFFTNYGSLLGKNTLPDEIYLQPFILEVPGMGKTFAVGFVWNGPGSEDSNKWLDDLASLAPGGTKMVAPTNPAGYVAQITSMVPLCAHRGSSQSFNVRGLVLSTEGIEVFAKHGGLLPGDGTLVSLHQLRGKAVRPGHPESVFRYREDHLMLEVIGFTGSQEKSQKGKEWADGFGSGIKGLNEVMEGGYYCLVPKGEAPMEAIYGEQWETVRKLKEKVDPGNVFQFAFAS